jgi:hypothetical protein
VHRIGQKSAVAIYRLITKSTYESQMFERASKKLSLDQAVLTDMRRGEDRDAALAAAQSDPARDRDVEALLRLGAYGVMGDDDDAGARAFCEANIDQILSSRSRVVKHGAMGAMDAGGGGGSSFGTSKSLLDFKKITFVAGGGDGGDGSEAGAAGAVNLVDVNDPDFWVKMLASSTAFASSAAAAHASSSSSSSSSSESEYDAILCALASDHAALAASFDARAALFARLSRCAQQALMDKRDGAHIGGLEVLLDALEQFGECALFARNARAQSLRWRSALASRSRRAGGFGGASAALPSSPSSRGRKSGRGRGGGRFGADHEFDHSFGVGVGSNESEAPTRIRTLRYRETDAANGGAEADGDGDEAGGVLGLDVDQCAEMSEESDAEERGAGGARRRKATASAKAAAASLASSSSAAAASPKSGRARGRGGASAAKKRKHIRGSDDDDEDDDGGHQDDSDDVDDDEAGGSAASKSKRAANSSAKKRKEKPKPKPSPKPKQTRAARVSDDDDHSDSSTDEETLDSVIYLRSLYPPGTHLHHIRITDVTGFEESEIQEFKILFGSSYHYLPQYNTPEIRRLVDEQEGRTPANATADSAASADSAALLPPALPSFLSMSR